VNLLGQTHASGTQDAPHWDSPVQHARVLARLLLHTCYVQFCDRTKLRPFNELQTAFVLVETALYAPLCVSESEPRLPLVPSQKGKVEMHMREDLGRDFIRTFMSAAREIWTSAASSSTLTRRNRGVRAMTRSISWRSGASGAVGASGLPSVIEPSSARLITRGPSDYACAERVLEPFDMRASRNQASGGTVPAVDDPTALRLSSRQVHEHAGVLMDAPLLAAMGVRDHASKVACDFLESDADAMPALVRCMRVCVCATDGSNLVT